MVVNILNRNRVPFKMTPAAIGVIECNNGVEKLVYFFL
jgi:hypothetical protein